MYDGGKVSLVAYKFRLVRFGDTQNQLYRVHIRCRQLDSKQKAGSLKSAAVAR